MKRPQFTVEWLRSVIHYDPKTGIFTWKRRADRENWNARYAGKRAGFSVRVSPRLIYWHVRLLDWPFPAHRLAWFYMTGAWPKVTVDHKDCDGLNNRWSNLREATKAQNGANRGVTKRNTTGFKGVSRSGNRFRATIQVDGKWREIGTFNTAEEAAAAYRDASIEGYGEFARSA